MSYFLKTRDTSFAIRPALAAAGRNWACKPLGWHLEPCGQMRACGPALRPAEPLAEFWVVVWGVHDGNRRG